MTSTGDPWNLARYVTAQDDADTYVQAVEELRSDRKVTHWMWFIFPQIAGLGQSATSRRFAITCLEEAKDYLLHPILGPRLLNCSNIVAESKTRDAVQIFGKVDAQKLQSSATLFYRASNDAVFKQILDKYFQGVADQATEALL